MSAPAQKPRPAPVNTIAPIERSSLAADTAAVSSVIIARRPRVHPLGAVQRDPQHGVDLLDDDLLVGLDRFDAHRQPPVTPHRSCQRSPSAGESGHARIDGVDGWTAWTSWVAAAIADAPGRPARHGRRHRRGAPRADLLRRRRRLDRRRRRPQAEADRAAAPPGRHHGARARRRCCSITTTRTGRSCGGSASGAGPSSTTPATRWRTRPARRSWPSTSSTAQAPPTGAVYRVAMDEVAGGGGRTDGAAASQREAGFDLAVDR